MRRVDCAVHGRLATWEKKVTGRRLRVRGHATPPSPYCSAASHICLCDALALAPLPLLVTTAQSILVVGTEGVQLYTPEWRVR